MLPGIVFLLIDNEEDLNKIDIIFNEYGSLMLDVSKNILKSKEDAEDAVQNTLIYIAIHIDKIDDPRSPQTRRLVRLAVTHRSINLYNSRRQRREMEQSLEVTRELEGGWQQATSEELLSDFDEKIYESIKKIPLKNRFVLEMNFVHGYELKEIASLLNIRYTTVRQRISRARKQLRKALEESGITDGKK